MLALRENIDELALRLKPSRLAVNSIDLANAGIEGGYNACPDERNAPTTEVSPETVTGKSELPDEITAGCME